MKRSDVTAGGHTSGRGRKRSEEVGRGRKRSEEVGKQEAVIHNREKRDGFLPKKFSADLYA